jgi:hypothetical protein
MRATIFSGSLLARVGTSWTWERFRIEYCKIASQVAFMLSWTSVAPLAEMTLISLHNPRKHHPNETAWSGQCILRKFNIALAFIWICSLELELELRAMISNRSELSLHRRRMLTHEELKLFVLYPVEMLTIRETICKTYWEGSAALLHKPLDLQLCCKYLLISNSDALY